MFGYSLSNGTFDNILKQAESIDRQRYNKAYRLCVNNDVRMLDPNHFEVKASDGGFYVVEIAKINEGAFYFPDDFNCECPDHVERGKVCKHILASLMYLKDQDIMPARAKKFAELAEEAKRTAPPAELTREIVVQIPRSQAGKLRIVIEMV